MWILPSRSRPANLARFITAWQTTSASTKLVLLLDADDPELPHYQALTLPPTWILHISQMRKALGAMVNDVVALYPNEPWYGFVDDDLVPITPHWDTEIAKSAGTNKLAWFDDGLKGEVLATHPVVGGDLIRELGWFALPGLDRLYFDTAMMAVGRRKNALVYRGDIKTEHRHFSLNPALFDETYKKPSARRDRDVYDRFLWSLDPVVHFVSVKWGTKYSSAYVNILTDMIRRNLPKDFGARFTCYTDDAVGIDTSIDIKPLPGDLSGWWNKLYLFKEGVCEEGARIFFLDLDTVILSDISDIANYRGEFAILRDFYRPQGLGSGIMLWRGGFGANIWDSFVKSGKPVIDGGDQAWIERCNVRPDILQDLYLGAFASYKEKGQIEPPEGSKIICFHGKPHPHEVTGNWVEEFWKIGGKSTAALSSNIDVITQNIRHSLSLSFPVLKQIVDADEERQVSIVGSGPSRTDSLQELQRLHQQGVEIWALDDAYLWLIEQGLKPEAHIMSSPKPDKAELVPGDPQTILLYASQCHPDVFKKAATTSNNIVLWHPRSDAVRAALGSEPALFIGGGSTLGMLSVGLAYSLGARSIHLFGFDSSYANENLASAEETMRVTVGERQFVTSLSLAQQVNEFRMLLQALIPQGAVLTLHGDGLLPYVMQQLREKAQL